MVWRCKLNVLEVLSLFKWRLDVAKHLKTKSRRNWNCFGEAPINPLSPNRHWEYKQQILLLYYSFSFDYRKSSTFIQVFDVEKHLKTKSRRNWNCFGEAPINSVSPNRQWQYKQQILLLYYSFFLDYRMNPTFLKVFDIAKPLKTKFRRNWNCFGEAPVTPASPNRQWEYKQQTVLLYYSPFLD